MKHALVIVNPVAGEQQPLQVADAACAHLRAAGWQVDVMPTRGAGHATELARAHGGDRALVVVVGGDGTLRETVVGLHEHRTPVGLVPIGKANVVARELDIPRTAAAAIELLTAGKVRPIDAGRVGDSVFLAMVGIGYDGWTTAGVGRMRATRWGGFLYRHRGASLVYAIAGLPALLRLLPGKVQVHCDDVALPGRYPSIVVSNTETYALGWAMTPGAKIDDGRLDHQANLRSAPWFVCATLIAAILRRRVPKFIASYGEGRRYRVVADRPFRWQVDGDPMAPVRELDIEVLPGYAQIVTPDPSHVNHGLLGAADVRVVTHPKA